MRGARTTIVAAAMLVFGCSHFEERHYFRSVDPRTNETINYFRLTVEGDVGVTRARYVSGQYDQRAVDFFFNELRTSSQPIFTLSPSLPKQAQSTTNQTSNEAVVQPLGTSGESVEGGAFVMILSTNAKSVADTIGEFAENQLVTEALTRVLNRDRLREGNELGAQRAESHDRSRAARASLDGMFRQLKAMENDSAEVVEDQCLRIIRTIAVALGSRGDFTTVDEAKSWLKTYERQRQGNATR